MGSSVSSQAQNEAALLEACAVGDIDNVQTLLAAKVDPDCFDDEQNTPLHIAAFCGHAAILHEILAVSVESLERPGQLDGTPLHVACTAGRCECVEMLLAAKASVHATDESELTPLHRASASGNVPTMEVLLRAGALVNATTLDAHTPLHVAASRGHSEVVRGLLEARADVGVRSAAGATAADILRHLSADTGEERTSIMHLLEHNQAGD